MQETWVQSLGGEDPLEEGVATRSSILGLENPHGQRNLAGYRPWGPKELDKTEKVMAPHSSTLAWRVPWTEEPGGLQSMGSRRVGHD